ncbi:hypothetical protein C8R44DRAFT_730414 [Mycena epipterygia]|nr:hypothetical protein C8R44DRAFT_730414 [Mycena epipterygia]
MSAFRGKHHDEKSVPVGIGHGRSPVIACRDDSDRPGGEIGTEGRLGGAIEESMEPPLGAGKELLMRRGPNWRMNDIRILEHWAYGRRCIQRTPSSDLWRLDSWIKDLWRVESYIGAAVGHRQWRAESSAVQENCGVAGRELPLGGWLHCSVLMSFLD